MVDYRKNNDNNATVDYPDNVTRKVRISRQNRFYRFSQPRRQKSYSLRVRQRIILLIANTLRMHDIIMHGHYSIEVKYYN